MKSFATLVLVGLLLYGYSYGQAKPQSHVMTKEQLAQAEEAAKVKALRSAKTAALVIRATTTISCPEGAPGDCIRTDKDIILQAQSLVNGTTIWEYFEKADATEADVFLEFTVREGSRVSFNVRDADSNKILYSEFREVVSLDNDINRIISHFLQSAPKRTEAEQEMYRRKERCAATASSFTIAQSYYEVRRKDYDWKNAHVDDAVMNECEEHWKDWVCLKHGQGDYASNWNDARTEFYRKLKLEYEELQDLERKMKSIQSGAEAGSCRGCK